MDQPSTSQQDYTEEAKILSISLNGEKLENPKKGFHIDENTKTLTIDIVVDGGGN